MCIAVYVPKNVYISDETIENCYDNNPDGAGIMWQENGKVHIKKGFFSVKELIRAFREVPDDLNRAIHCRIATSGKVSQECCHPFPITKDMKQMTKTEQTVHSAVIHNGVISFCAPHEGIKARYSDTMLFTKDYLYPMGELILHHSFKKLFEESNSSKLLIFKGNKVALIGDWIEEDGVFYSNTGYKFCWSRYCDYGWYDYYGYKGSYKGGKASKDSTKSADDITKTRTTYDLYDLIFTIPKTESMDCYEEMDNILTALERQNCYPDDMSAYETCEDDYDQLVFMVTCLKLPTTTKILGYEYVVAE